MRSTNNIYSRVLTLLSFVVLYTANVTAQSTLAKEKEFVGSSGDRLWYTIFFLFVVAMAVVSYFWWKKRKDALASPGTPAKRTSDYYRNESYEIESGDREIEWLRKAKKPQSRTAKKVSPGPNGIKKNGAMAKAGMPSDADTKLFQEKMKRLQYSQLPINSFGELAPSRPYDQLSISNDPNLLNAIEQAGDEYEEDEDVRDLALRILTAFRNKNSVEALTEIALYDLSSNLRSKAVSTLTDFDHESVFEAILLACADPTREVRAAAARGLFRLNFDRADAWKRLIETNDEFRMSHAARAAIEAGIVVKSFERLVHEDLKVAYEAYALVALLIKSGETHEIFESLRTHKDERVKLALIHVLRAFKDERTLPELNRLYKNELFPTDITNQLKELIESFEKVEA